MSHTHIGTHISDHTLHPCPLIWGLWCRNVGKDTGWWSRAVTLLACLPLLRCPSVWGVSLNKQVPKSTPITPIKLCSHHNLCVLGPKSLLACLKELTVEQADTPSRLCATHTRVPTLNLSYSIYLLAEISNKLFTDICILFLENLQVYVFLFSFSIPSSPKVFSFYDFSLFCCCCIFLLGCKKPCTGLISHFWTKQQLVMQCQLVFCFCGCIQWRLRVAYSVVILCFTKQHRLAVQISKVPFFSPSFWSGPLAIAVVPHYVNNSIHRNVLLAT